MSARRIQRRRFLRGAAGLTAGAAVVGCGAGTAAPAIATTAPAQTAAATGAAPTAAAVVKYADRACVFRYLTGGFTQAGPEDVLVKQLQEEALRRDYGLNVDIQFESAGWADIDQLMELRLQTQGCDGLQRYNTPVLKWIATAGLIRDIDAEVKAFGQHLTDLIPQAAWQYFMRGDQKYVAIPSQQATPCDVEFTHIRRDWLRKIDRDIPTTYEELEECLRLFREKRLGGDVTIPFTLPVGGWMPWAIYGPWTPEPEEQIRMLDGGRPIFIESNMNLERLEMLQRWYRDGLLNQEWLTWKEDQAYAACSKGMVGCIQDGHWLINGTLANQVMKDDPTQDWVQIFPPLGLKDRPNTGRVSGASYGPIERGVVVASWAACPEAIVALADWENSSFENYVTARHGIEGKHWKYGDNGSIVDLRSAAPNWEYSGMRATGWALKWSNQYAFLPPQPGNEPLDPEVTPRVRKCYNTRAVADVPEQGEYPAMPQVDRWCAYSFPKSAKFMGDMDTIFSEYLGRIINGELEVGSGTKEFWDRWYAAGGQTQMEEQTEQWSAFSAAHPEWKETKATFAPEFWNTTPKYPEAEE